MKSRSLDIAKRLKDDEFYTPMDCIETEVEYYKDQL